MHYSIHSCCEESVTIRSIFLIYQFSLNVYQSNTILELINKDGNRKIGVGITSIVDGKRYIMWGIQ